MGALKLGVFGGTFNPIHLGHLHLARRAQRIFDLTQIQFVVATSPPHKQHEVIIPFIHRYTMVGLATSRTSSFVPSVVELDPPRSSFSLHTMEKLARQTLGGSHALYFVAGGDSLLEVSGWHRSEELLRAYNFIFVARPGVAGGDAAPLFPRWMQDRIVDLRGLEVRRLRSRVRKEMSFKEPRVFIIDAGAPDISSSQIRGMVTAGKPVNHLVPFAVNQYIHKLHLYGER